MAVKLLDAATATGVSSSWRQQRVPRNHTVQATMGGTVVATAVTLDLEGSSDDTNWFQLANHPFSAAEITATSAMFHVANKPVRYVRVNLTTLTGGTAPTITALYEGEKDG